MRHDSLRRTFTSLFPSLQLIATLAALTKTQTDFGNPGNVDVTHNPNILKGTAELQL